MVEGISPGTSLYVSYETLLTLPQVTVAVTGDDNFAEIPRKKIIVTGISLAVLTNYLGALPGSNLVSALCSDDYRAIYTHDYVLAHLPIFALKIDGLPVKDTLLATAQETR